MVICGLIKVDEWILLTKFSINYMKFMHFVTGKSLIKLRKKVIIKIPNVVLHRKTSVKYLGVFLDESHVKY